jgi:uncharacterized protein (TIGR03437 family)
MDATTFAVQSIAPGELIKVSGFWSTTDGNSAVGQTDPLPTSLDGVEVLINGTPAPILRVGLDVQVLVLFTAIVQVPMDIDITTNASVQVRLTDANGSCVSNQISTPVSAAMPELASINGQPLVVNQRGQLVSADNPVIEGSFVSFYGIGFGRVPDLPSGTIVKHAMPLAPNRVSFKVDGQKVEASYIGAAPGSIGGYQFNVGFRAGLWTLEVDGNAVRSFRLP